jgi:hypothetical protein
MERGGARSSLAAVGLALLASIGLWSAVAAQESDTHPLGVQGVWAHQGALDATGVVEWAVIRFAEDGCYRAARVRASGEQAQHVGEVISGQWAVVRSAARGAALCTRPEGETFSHCNRYSVAGQPPELWWNEVAFVLPDRALLARLDLAAF